MTGRLTMYTTTWCGYCVRLKRGLERAGIEFDEVNIETRPGGRGVRAAASTAATPTVPTLLLPNGEVMTNPPLPDLLAAVSPAATVRYLPAVADIAERSTDLRGESDDLDAVIADGGGRCACTPDAGRGTGRSPTPSATSGTSTAKRGERSKSPRTSWHASTLFADPEATCASTSRRSAAWATH